MIGGLLSRRFSRVAGQVRDSLVQKKDFVKDLYNRRGEYSYKRSLPTVVGTAASSAGIASLGLAVMFSVLGYADKLFVNDAHAYLRENYSEKMAGFMPFICGVMAVVYTMDKVKSVARPINRKIAEHYNALGSAKVGAYFGLLVAASPLMIDGEGYLGFVQDHAVDDAVVQVVRDTSVSLAVEARQSACALYDFTRSYHPGAYDYLCK